MMRLAKSVVLYALLVWAGHSAAASTVAELIHEGTRYRLQGNFQEAYRIAEELKRLEPSKATGYAFHLNTLISRLSWDRKATRFDEAIETNVQQALTICEPKLKEDSENALAWYHCGQANFALSFLKALRGSYYASGINGTRAIERLEQALRLDPSLVDAKLQLGMSYYYADNLPPFFKAMSFILWFIPTGDSNKSLPYIKDVIENGNYSRHIAKFVYADLVREQDDPDYETVLKLLNDLVKVYPQNIRFQMARLGSLNADGRHQRTAEVAETLMGKESWTREDRFMISMWQVEAYLALGKVERAQARLDAMGDIPAGSPSWVGPWYRDIENRVQAAAESGVP